MALANNERTKSLLRSAVIRNTAVIVDAEATHLTPRKSLFGRLGQAETARSQINSAAVVCHRIGLGSFDDLNISEQDIAEAIIKLNS